MGGLADVRDDDFEVGPDGLPWREETVRGSYWVEATIPTEDLVRVACGGVHGGQVCARSPDPS